MDKNNLKTQIKRLVDEADIIAPSINTFKNNDYGNFTDDDFDPGAFVTWKMEAKAILNQLSKLNPDIFTDLYKQYLSDEEASKRWHSESILVHKIQQLLVGAFSLIDSPLLDIKNESMIINKTDFKVELGYAFVAMPLDPEDPSLIDILDAVKEATQRCGVRAERIDEPPSNDRITDRIMESIQKAEFVIVDLSKLKPNVFFEAGYAHGLGKIPIYFAKFGTIIEFDLKDYPILFYRNLKELKDSIEKRIKGLKLKERT
jgi:hypothetical protein